jgi:hypothetical protein
MLNIQSIVANLCTVAGIHIVSHSKNVQFPSLMSWVGPRAIVEWLRRETELPFLIKKLLAHDLTES